MKSENEIEQDITEIIMKINSEFPELSKYITEMPIRVPNTTNVEVNRKSLEEYYHSLKEMLEKYKEENENK